MKIKKIYIILLILLALCICIIPYKTQMRQSITNVILMMKGKKTVDDRLSQYSDVVHERLTPKFIRAGINYPPRRVTLVGLKAEKILQVWVSDSKDTWIHLGNYPILGTSGTLGPKLKEGDMQVPEGIYKVDSLNPNSLYHLAIRVNYPNSHDRLRGKQDGRSNLGSDIMIHGNSCSIGCLAMGDEAAEDLFVLAAETGLDNVTIILAPVDFRVRQLPAQTVTLPLWTNSLYYTIKTELEKLGKSTINGTGHGSK